MHDGLCVAAFDGVVQADVKLSVEQSLLTFVLADLGLIDSLKDLLRSRVAGEESINIWKRFPVGLPIFQQAFFRWPA